MEDQNNSSQEPAELSQEISDLSQETTEKNSEISSLSQEAEKDNETAEISSAKEDTTEDCTSLGLDIVFYTDEGQIFELTPFVDISSIVLEEKIVDPSLKTAASQFSFSVSGLSEEFLNFLFFRNEDIFVKVNNNNTPVFRGILENFLAEICSTALKVYHSRLMTIQAS